MAESSCGAIAIIPARGGSKRIPRKNIRPFLGVPLIERTIRVLCETGVFARIVVSTDDDEVARVARAAGAEVPFRRPASLSDDFAGTVPVIAHAVRELERGGMRHDAVCCAYATAVLSMPGDYQRAATMLLGSDTNYVLAGTSYGYPIQRALRLRNGGIEMFQPEHRATRSQDLEPAYHDAGQFYFGTREAWLEERPLFSPASRLLILPRYRVQDIDTIEDWEAAEVMWQLVRGERR